MFGWLPNLDKFEFLLVYKLKKYIKNTRHTKWLSVQKLLKSGKIIVRKPNVANTAAYKEALSIIPSDSSFRLEYVTHTYGGLFLEARVINLEAEIANIDRRYNTNFIKSAPLNKLKLKTLKSHPCLTKEKYAFGLVIFSHNPLDIYQYTMLAKHAMAEILLNFDQSIKL